MLNDFIYSDICSPVLYSINKALLACIKLGKHNPKLVSENPELIKCFESLVNLSIDQHIIEGLFESHQKRGEKVYPRILKLTINAFNDAQEVKVTSRFVIPSPLHVLYYILIAPEHPQTAAYSLAACRTLLFNLLEKVYRSNNDSREHELINSIDEESITLSADSLSRHIKIQARWPREFKPKSVKSYVNLIVGHFLAMKGITHLSFNNQKEAEDFLSAKNSESFLDEFGLKLISSKFRLSKRYEELPDTGELINQLYGIPLPIKGADIVFFGGLKPSSTGGLVMGVSGQAGIGKTSFALALANSLAPLGIKCFYLSLEEGESDIKKRLFSLQTPFEKELSYYKNPKEWFFSTKKTKSLKLRDLLIVIEKFKIELELELKKKKLKKQYHSIIVIDNLNEFSSDPDFLLIEQIVERARELKSIVILIGGEGILEKLKMEYLIDVGIKLLHESLEKQGDKPLRLFNLYKTRHQLSRQGTHVFHMSGNEGFRISPQIPSQMDRKEKLKKLLHAEDRIINTLNYLNDDGNMDVIESTGINRKNKNNCFVKLFPRTHILVHGYGSAGKAGFALKILLTPPIDAETKCSSVRKYDYSNSIYRRKVLIISFLYPQQYYNDLIYDKVELQKIINSNYPFLQSPIIDYLIFYPGYISPEDFINKITRRLDRAILEGQPFNGVLIDGLHNVFLQFVRLQNTDMVWPLIYSILARYDLTVVSTFTNFALNDRLIDDDPNSRNAIINQALPDHMLLQKGMAPFLHALVKASDFYFFLEQLVLKTGERKYLLSIKGAISQDVPTEMLEWDRQRNVFIEIHKYQEILKLLREEVK